VAYSQAIEPKNGYFEIGAGIFTMEVLYQLSYPGGFGLLKPKICDVI
jgi:hypothetical protein